MMTPHQSDKESSDETRHARGIDLQLAYAVLIRAYLRRRGLHGNRNPKRMGEPSALHDASL